MLPPLLNGYKEKMLFCADEILTNFIFFRLFTTFKLTVFRQQVCPTKTGEANALSLGTNNCKRGTWLL